MTTLKTIIILLTFTTIYSCNNSVKDKTETTQKNSVVNDKTINSDKTNNSKSSTNEEKIDSITTIKFNELSISINSLPMFYNDRQMNQIQYDTVEIFPEIGYTVEGQIFTLNRSLLKDLKIEQSYETSIGVYMNDENAENDGGYCYLNDWKHYESEWKSIKIDSLNKFIYPKYTDKERQIFNTPIEEVKMEVYKRCGKKTSGELKSVNEAPCEVSISKYFLRIMGKRIRDGKLITIFISFDNSEIE